MSSEPLRCATCGAELEPLDVHRGVMWVCRHCGGRAVGIGLLRRTVVRDYANELWGNAIESGRPGDHSCPSCRRQMISAPAHSLDLDVCKTCQLVWFDPGEFDTAPVIATVPSRQMPQEALEVVARQQAIAIAAEYKRRYGQELPLDEALLLVPGVMGLPLEEEGPPMETIPWATWTIAVLVFLASLYSLLVPDVSETLGLLPRDAFRYGGATFVTAFFVHSSAFLAFTNLYFLAIFGDNVEDWLGSATFVMLAVVGAVAGEGMHALFTDERAVPLTGATAGVAAIVLFYGLKFPQAKLRYLRVFRWYTMPAGAALGLWLVANLFGATDLVVGAGDASTWVYLGGGVVGLVFWLALRNEPAVPRPVRSGS